MKTFTFILPAWNGAAFIGDCLSSLEPQLQAGDEMIVVDNGSTDGTPGQVERQFPRAQLLRQERNLGYGGGANCGIVQARTDAVVILNQDIVFKNGCVAALRQRLKMSGPAVIGGKLLYPDGQTIQHAGGVIHMPRGAADHYGYRQLDDGSCDQVMEPDYVTGALFVVDCPVFEAIGGFDEGFYPAYYEEVDYCYRAREAGFPVIYEPQAVAIHHESQTQNKRSVAYHQTMEYHRVRFMLKHFSPEQLLSGFFPAERDYVLRLAHLFARSVFARAYLHALLNLPAVNWLQADEAARHRVIDALADLYRLACQTAQGEAHE
jgi:O-antigen biosynthesis protein